MRFVFTSLICGFVLGLSSAYAHVEKLAVDVLSFTSDPDGNNYVLRFRAVTTDYGDKFNLPQKEREFTVHLRLDPESPSALEARQGMNILRKRYQKDPEMVIGRMSGRGWRAIPGRKGEFQSIGVKVHYPKNSASDDDAIVYFIHDDRY